MTDIPSELKVYKHTDPVVFSHGHYKIMVTEHHGYQLVDEKNNKLIDGIVHFCIEHTIGSVPQVTLTLNAPVDVELPEMGTTPIRIS